MRILCHPDNRVFFENLKHDWSLDFLSLAPPPNLDGIPVTFDESIPKYNFEEVWRPPKGDRFVSYGPEDEAWMRPLGLGQIDLIDHGPCYFIVDDPLYHAVINFAPPIGLSGIKHTTC